VPRLLTASVIFVVGVVAAVLVAVGLVLAFREGADIAVTPPGEPAARLTPTATPSPSGAPVTAGEVAALFRRALPALGDEDEQAWGTALPATGSGRRALAALYGNLAPLQPARLVARVEAPPGLPGAFDITIAGQVAGVGAPDRFLAERVLVVKRVGGRLVVTDDETPAQIERQEFMAFAKPRVLVHDGAVVVFDATWSLRAEQLAALVPGARDRVARVLHAGSPRPITILVFSSADEVHDYLANPSGIEERMVFQAYPVVRLSARPWYPNDIMLVAPELSAWGDAMATTLTHEVTHVLTASWFAHAPNRSPLLNEGLAVVVAQDRRYRLLKRELATGNRVAPLLQAIAYTDLWGGHTTEQIELLYEEGGSVVSYIVDTWGAGTLRRFLVDLGTTNLTETPIKLAVRRDLGVSWAQFVAGWRAYVPTLP
jgi:hypothetical protein